MYDFIKNLCIFRQCRKILKFQIKSYMFCLKWMHKKIVRVVPGGPKCPDPKIKYARNTLNNIIIRVLGVLNDLKKGIPLLNGEK